MMKIPIVLLLVVSTTVARRYSEFYPVRLSRSPSHEAARRVSVGYISKVIHQNPNNPDQIAESSVKVNLNPADPQNNLPTYGSSSQKTYTRGQKYASLGHQEQQPQYNLYQQEYQQHPQQYHQPNQYHKREQHQDYRQPQEYEPEYQQTQTKYQHESQPQSQSFNVGYSMRLTHSGRENRPNYVRSQKLEQGEIITGTRKGNEQVSVPNGDVSPQEYVTASLIESKQHKLSGIKPKARYFPASSASTNTKVLLSQANLSPTTQKYLKALDYVKTLENQEEPKVYQQKYAWRNLSPNVQIIKSTEIPVTQKYISSRHMIKFDQNDAVGGSPDGFEHTNSIDLEVQKQQPTQVPVSPALYKPIYQPLIPTENQPLALPYQQPSPILLSSSSDQQIQVVPKLPVDTRLIRNPILTTDPSKVTAVDPSVIPIHFDTRLIQEAMEKELATYEKKVQNNFDHQPQYSTIAQQPFNVDIHNYQPPTELKTYMKMLQHLQNQNTKQSKPYQDSHQEQSQTHFKIYGKPQPNPISNLDFSGFKAYSQRQPRYRPSKDYGLHTKLRPPPLTHKSFQRRYYRINDI